MKEKKKMVGEILRGSVKIVSEVVKSHPVQDDKGSCNDIY